jgi:tRNA 2-thiouridine synthesizing protein C
MKQHKRILVVMTKSPYSSGSMQEALDILLAAGTFDQDVQLLITEDACFVALPQQQAEHIHRKNLPKTFNALALYGIERIYIDRKQAEQRGVTQTPASLKMEYIDQPDIAKLYKDADVILRF